MWSNLVFSWASHRFGLRVALRFWSAIQNAERFVFSEPHCESPIKFTQTRTRTSGGYNTHAKMVMRCDCGTPFLASSCYCSHLSNGGIAGRFPWQKCSFILPNIKYWIDRWLTILLSLSKITLSNLQPWFDHNSNDCIPYSRISICLFIWF